MVESSHWIIGDYQAGSGVSPIRTFLQSLEKEDLADALALIKPAEGRGNQLREPHSKALGGGRYELRGKQVRLFYAFGPERRIITLLSGIIKKQARIPESALTQAGRFKADLEASTKSPKRK